MMKKLTILFLLATCVSAGAYAQYFVSTNLPNPTPAKAITVLEGTADLGSTELSKFDFSGHWEGTRFQYTAKHDAILKEFRYEFDLRQHGNTVSGTTTIEGSNGDYAVMKVRGYVVGNKLYFEEYEVQDEMKDDDMVWCYKVGELSIGTNGTHDIAYGPTNSYTTSYYLPCTGGFTVVEKVKDENTATLLSDKSENKGVVDAQTSTGFSINAYPNPFATVANVEFSTDKEMDVKVDLISIEGKTISTLENAGKLQGGTYKYSINGQSLGLQNGVYIVRVQMGDVVYSQNLVFTNL